MGKARLLLTLAISVFCGAAADAGIVVAVPGDSDPYLAGMPDGSTASIIDVAPDESPAEVVGLSLVPGAALTFSVTGNVSFNGVNFGPTPDGDPGNITNHFNNISADGKENGISDIVASANALLGVFLDAGQPDFSPAPGRLDFRPSGNVAGGFDYLTLSPVLKQVFFIGDGFTSGAVQQEVIVPAGATRLFLATMDGVGWKGNLGAFSVDVESVASLDLLSEPSSLALLSLTLLIVGVLCAAPYGWRRRLRRT